MALVVAVDQDGIHKYCGNPGPGKIMHACHRILKSGLSVVFVPLPCTHAATEYYAYVMCHELGHSRGWSGNHEE